MRNSPLVLFGALVIGVAVAVTWMALPADPATTSAAGVARLLLTGVGGIALAALVIGTVLSWVDDR
jgi:hypothetical protein